MELLIEGIVPTNFIWSDAGRSQSRRPGQKRDCVVRALAEVTGQQYDVAYDYIMGLGRKSHKGFHLERYLDRSSQTGESVLGYKVVKHSFPAILGRERMYVGAFCVFYPTGRFIVRQAKHLAAVIDGKLYDLYWDCYRCVYTAFEFVEVD